MKYILLFVMLILSVAVCTMELRAVTAEDRVVEALEKGNAALCKMLVPDLEDYDRIMIAGREFLIVDRVVRKGMWELLPVLVEQGADPEAVNYSVGQERRRIMRRR